MRWYSKNMVEVYFKSADTPFAKDALFLAIEKFMEKANINKNEIVAVKLHMGEFGNVGYVRPVFVRKVVDAIKKKGGKPFITDTTTLYGGKRGNAIDYLETASVNGFNLASMNCPIIIADGLFGNDEEIISVNGNKIAIAKAIFEADYLVVLSHFKGHGMAGFGGAIKNLAMGCCSKNGKLWQHEVTKPLHNSSKCTLCLKCIKFCPAEAIYEENGKIKIDYEKCRGCGACLVLCENHCFYLSEESIKKFHEKLALAAKAIMEIFKEKVFFINFLMDITPRCDCCSFAGKPIINDIGILASKDAVAIDKASYDLVLKEAKKDIFYEEHKIDGKLQLEKAKILGVGNMEYKLIKI